MNPQKMYHKLNQLFLKVKAEGTRPHYRTEPETAYLELAKENILLTIRDLGNSMSYVSIKNTLSNLDTYLYLRENDLFYYNMKISDSEKNVQLVESAFAVFIGDSSEG